MMNKDKASNEFNENLTRKMLLESLTSGSGNHKKVADKNYVYV